MSRLSLTSGQRRRLREQLITTQNVRVYQRTLAVLEFDGGRSMADIAGMLGVTRQSVHNWVGFYERTHNPLLLGDAKHAGRPRLLGAVEEAWLEEVLAAAP